MRCFSFICIPTLLNRYVMLDSQCTYVSAKASINVKGLEIMAYFDIGKGPVERVAILFLGMVRELTFCYFQDISDNTFSSLV